QDAVVVATGGGALAGQVLGAEARDQVRHRGRLALSLDRAQWVAAVLDVAPQLPGPLTRHSGAPDGGVADGVGTLPPGPTDDVAQDIRPRPVGGDANAEALHLAVRRDLLARCRRRQPPDDGVREPLSLNHDFPRARPMPVALTGMSGPGM